MSRVAYFFIKYPLVSQTFLQREIAALAELGFEVEIFSLWTWRSAGKINLPAGVRLHEMRPWQYASLLWKLPGEVHFRPARVGAALRVLFQNPPNHLDNWLQTLLGAAGGICAASRLRRLGVEHMHGAWATGPATAALVASYCCHKSFSFGAHAYDIYQHGGDALLFVKLRACSFVHTTTRAGERRLLEIDPAAESRITLARRGLARLPEPIARKEGQTLGTSDGDPLRLLSVARLVPKKNQAIQLDALRLLRDSGIHAKLKIIGAGPLLSVLKERAEKLNLSDHVEFAGELSHDAVQAAYPEADIFLHTGIVDSRGDRDGLPNVVPEAMSHGLPVVSSPTAGVTEAVEHLVTGLIADPLTADSIATCLQILAQDAALRLELTTNARQWLKEEFIVLNNVRKLARRFRVAIRDYKPPALPR